MEKVNQKRKPRIRKRTEDKETLKQIEFDLSNSLELLLINSSFAGCEYIGKRKESVPTRHTEFYRLPYKKLRNSVGIWDSEGHVMIGPIEWYTFLKDQDQIIMPSKRSKPRNRGMKLRKLRLLKVGQFRNGRRTKLPVRR